MPLHIWLKEPPMQILVKGEVIRRKDWRKRRLGLFPRRMCVLGDNGAAFMFDARNVLMVKTITQQEIEEAKKRMETEIEEAKKRGGAPRVQPAMMVPGMRKTS